MNQYCDILVSIQFHAYFKDFQLKVYQLLCEIKGGIDRQLCKKYKKPMTWPSLLFLVSLTWDREQTPLFCKRHGSDS